MISLDEINDYDQIKQIIENTSSEDGELKNFEIKGTNGALYFSKEIKANICKEVSAFANTYGGIILLHRGKDGDIQPFMSSYIVNNFKKIESWIGDCLEPRLNGIDIRSIDNFILLEIPESKIKPHRTTGKNQNYFYRNVSQSKPMPEIMISSMYKSHDFISLRINLLIQKLKSELSFTLTIKNNSNICGTNPKIQIELFGRHHVNLNPQHDDDHYNSNIVLVIYNEINELIKDDSIGFVSTGINYSENILYPKDALAKRFVFERIEEMQSLNYLLVKVDCMFKESGRYSTYFLYQLKEDSQAYFITSTNYISEKLIISKYIELSREEF